MIYIEESKDPRRTIPTATYVTIAVIGGAYALASWVQISAAEPKPIDRASVEGADLFFNEAAVILGGASVTVGKSCSVPA